MKKVIATLALAPLLFAGCGGGSEEKLLAIFTDITCLAQMGSNARAESSKEGFDMKEFRAKTDKASNELNALMKSSFAKEEDMKNAYKAIADKGAFKKKVADSAMAKCGGTQENIDKVFEEVDKDTK